MSNHEIPNIELTQEQLIENSNRYLQYKENNRNNVKKWVKVKQETKDEEYYKKSKERAK